jgi:hypothetical protein
MSQIKFKEFEWYFRDYVFRSFNKGIKDHEMDLIPNYMIVNYLRYKNSNLEDVISLLNSTVDRLVLSSAIRRVNNKIIVEGTLTRFQCSKCYYISYIFEKEQKICLRCSSNELKPFLKK